MALKASGFAGTAKLHDLTAGGVSCDICGDEVDSEVADAVALDCSFAQCDPESSCYHTHCLEKFLKSIKCERNRKIGFPCPRGCGKNTKFKEACRGKILKSHPVTIRSEANKKRRQAELDQLAQQTAAWDKVACKKEDEVRAAAATKASKVKEKGKATKPAAIKALNVANTTITSAAPPKTQAQLQKEQLAAAAKNLKSQILARTSSTASSTSSAATAAAASSKLATSASGRLSATGSVGSKKEVKTLDEYLAERTGASSAALERSSSIASSVAPAASAWGKSRASSASSLEAGELADVASSLPPSVPTAPALAPAAAPLNSEEPFPPPAAAVAAALTGPGKPPRPPAAAAAAATAPVPVPIPTAATVQPQGVWAQKPAVAVMAAAALPPPLPHDAAASATAGPAEASTKAKSAAATAVAAAEDSNLSRTQRKNQRRAEKKAAVAAAAKAVATSSPDAASSSPSDSLPTSPQAHSAAAAAAAGFGGEEGSGVSTSGGGLSLLGFSEGFERCMQALVQHKLQRQVEQLQQLGFPGGATLVAVQQHGGSLDGALVALIEQATGVQDSMHGLGLSGSAGPAEVDLSEELQHMQELQTRHGLLPGTMEMLAVEYQGDLDSLAASLVRQQHGMLAYSGGGIAQQQHAVLAQQLAGQAALPAEPLSPGGSGLFGTLLPSVGSGQSYSADSWGQSTYSAFGFGGFAEAALNAVHSGGPAALEGGLLGSMDGGGMGTPTSRDQPSALPGARIWGSNPASLAGSGGGAGAASGAYGSEAHLLSMLDVSDAPGTAAASAGSSGFGLLGSFDPLQPSSTQSIFDPRPQPAGGRLLQQQQLAGSSGWQSSEGLGAGSGRSHPQPPLAGLPLWSSGSSGLGGLGAASSTDDFSLLVR